MSWQPIETAPKDGTHILGGDARKNKAYGGRICVRWNLIYGHWETVPGKWSISPTNWQHLPAPPEMPDE